MKLHRIRIEQFRKFNQAIEIAGLEDGLNVLHGPNEAGKSTIASALRTLFLEKHNTGGGEFTSLLSPVGAGNAAPTVEAEFSLLGQECQASKTFLVRPRARLTIGTESWEGGDADKQLASRLGFGLSGAGASRAATRGIPGLLWIEQGSASALEEPVTHAEASLAERLKSIMGDIASTSGGRLAVALRAELGKLRTATGRSTGILDAAEKALAASAERRDALLATSREYQTLTDRLSRDLAEQGRLTAERHWESLERERRAAESQLAELQPQQRDLDASRQRLRELNARITSLHTQAEDRTRELALLAAQRTTLKQLREQQNHETQAMQRADENRSTARAALGAARQQHEAAQACQQRLSLQAEIQRCGDDIVAVDGTLAKAQAFQAALVGLREQSGAVRLSTADLARFEQLDRELRETRIQREAIATRVVFRLGEGQRIDLGTSGVLEGTGSLLITDPLTLHLPGLGEIEIAPGGEDIARLAEQSSRLEDALTTLGASLGVSGLAEAQARCSRHQELEREIELKDVECSALLGGSEVSAWQARLADLRGRQQDQQQVLARLPELQVELSLDDARHAREEAEVALTACEEQFELNRRSIVEAGLECEGLQGRIKAATDRLEGEAADSAAQSAARELLEAVARRDGLQEKIGAAEAKLAALRPEDLEADVQRLQLAIDLVNKQRSTLHEAITAARAKLETLGADGLDEKLAGAEIEVENLGKRLAHYRLRADALGLLCSRLGARQEEAIQRLYAPLRVKLDHYLRQLFPANQVTVDIDKLRPSSIARDNAALGFEQHSHGTREQLGVIARFAYADLLKEAGQPTLIVLDDALVHSDEARRQQMKRILHDASLRHQILLFTCHPEHWRDAGARVLIDVAGLYDAAA
ncbi:AAA family ATPase [Luteimonas sp. MC1572]|uniref:AAA family ATPase n=1 Tax=Luteimonas sp. MC1572 TaxID=2799325 RepID=UPI0018F0E921|nr:AAA family ATPase [Luteimonas sp. MC1572]MBJ6981675.1 AAA family ATPase [Luteimonas sp. MC1572]QQO02967.1 AAA family ATPase [Luteimonas sp. MC1572]